ncbi:unnamed protein product [Phytophthora fragariaefolia]|uniref:Unnamed protein product n=1 Tax=Phytophthora fragariaefolia TaxID=1490495 RepID=A0A9W7D8L5_9STRA|nr:unnamed protein product [Phytophthora fragariaefolia]
MLVSSSDLSKNGTELPSRSSSSASKASSSSADLNSERAAFERRTGPRRQIVYSTVETLPDETVGRVLETEEVTVADLGWSSTSASPSDSTIVATDSSLDNSERED